MSQRELLDRSCISLFCKMTLVLILLKIVMPMPCKEGTTIPDTEYNIRNSFGNYGSSGYLASFKSDSGYLYHAGTADLDAILIKEDSTDTLHWVKVFPSFIYSKNGFIVSPAEDNIFIVESGSQDRALILQISPTDGTLTQTVQTASYSTKGFPSADIKTQMDPSGTTLYLTLTNHDNYPEICRWVVTDYELQCTQVFDARKIDILLYVNEYYSYAAAEVNDFEMVMIDWHESEEIWHRAFRCGVDEGCHFGPGVGLEYDSAIYSLFNFGASSRIVLLAHHISTGERISDIWMGNSGNTLLDSIVFHDVIYILSLKFSTTLVLMQYNIIEEAIGSSMEFEASHATFIKNTGGKVLFLVGKINDKAWKLGMKMSDTSDLNVASLSLEAMNNHTAELANMEDSMSIRLIEHHSSDYFANEFSPYDPMNTNYIPDIENSWQTNINSITSEYWMTVSSAETFDIYAYCTCTTTPERTDIDYSLLTEKDDSLFNWLSLNEASRTFQGTAPRVRNKVTFPFNITAQWVTNPAGVSIQKVFITVNPRKITGSVQALLISVVTSSIVLVVASGIAASILAMVQGTSFSSFYLVLNQIKIILFLLIIDPFVPEVISEYLESQSFSMLTLNFISSRKIPGIRDAVELVDTVQSDPALRSLSYESESAILNQLGFITTLALISLFHFLLRFVFTCGSKDSDRRSKCCKHWHNIRKKIINFIFYALYFRLLLQAHESMVISSISEVYIMNLDGFLGVISFVIACVILLWTIALCVITFYCFWVNQNNFDPEIKFFYMETFADIRNSRYARIYTSAMLSRMSFFVIMIICLKNVSRNLVYPPILTLQCIYLGSIIRLRPFEAALNNIIEILNEVLIIIISIILYILYTAERWDSFLTPFLTLLFINSVITCLILIIGTIIALVSFMKKKFATKKGETKDSIQHADGQGCSEFKSSDQLPSDKGLVDEWAFNIYKEATTQKHKKIKLKSMGSGATLDEKPKKLRKQDSKGLVE
ncbi:unnamed protein product [Moneuplotes crassus]|uniref:Uncharacterized protein n=1 Tax=Euplotes crassus TaxID=5936 RepID=A0AAD1XBS6_EUPCR|nr:unnamed protein product [Moneuplotes crassus]